MKNLYVALRHRRKRYNHHVQSSKSAMRCKGFVDTRLDALTSRQSAALAASCVGGSRERDQERCVGDGADRGMRDLTPFAEQGPTSSVFFFELPLGSSTSSSSSLFSFLPPPPNMENMLSFTPVAVSLAFSAVSEAVEAMPKLEKGLSALSTSMPVMLIEGVERCSCYAKAKLVEMRWSQSLLVRFFFEQAGDSSSEEGVAQTPANKWRLGCKAGACIPPAGFSFSFATPVVTFSDNASSFLGSEAASACFFGSSVVEVSAMIVAL